MIFLPVMETMETIIYAIKYSNMTITRLSALRNYRYPLALLLRGSHLTAALGSACPDSVAASSWHLDGYTDIGQSQTMATQRRSYCHTSL